MEDVTGHWTKVANLGDVGAVLVRPDQHVLWRSLDDAGPDAVDRLADALQALAGRPAGAPTTTPETTDAVTPASATIATTAPPTTAATPAAEAATTLI